MGQQDIKLSIIKFLAISFASFICFTEVPVRELSADVPLKDLEGSLVDRGRGRGRGMRGRGMRGRPAPRQMQEVKLIEEENPEGWTGDDSNVKPKSNDALANISLTDGDDDDAILQHKQHRSAASPATPSAQSPGGLKLAATPTIASPTVSSRGRGGAPRGAPRGRGAPARGRGGALGSFIIYSLPYDMFSFSRFKRCRAEASSPSPPSAR